MRISWNRFISAWQCTFSPTQETFCFVKGFVELGPEKKKIENITKDKHRRRMFWTELMGLRDRFPPSLHTVSSVGECKSAERCKKGLDVQIVATKVDSHDIGSMISS